MNQLNKVIPVVAHQFITVVCRIDIILKITDLKRSKVNGQHAATGVLTFLDHIWNQFLELLGPRRLRKVASVDDQGRIVALGHSFTILSIRLPRRLAASAGSFPSFDILGFSFMSFAPPVNK